MVETKYYAYVITEYPEWLTLRGSRIGGMNSDSTLGTPTWKDVYVTR